jgi:hypothetical protein
MIKATIDPARSAKDKKDIRGILEFTKVDLAAVKGQAKKRQHPASVRRFGFEGLNPCFATLSSGCVLVVF